MQPTDIEVTVKTRRNVKSDLWSIIILLFQTVVQRMTLAMGVWIVRG